MRLKTVVCAVLFALTLGVFLQTSRHQFLYFDDPLYITQNAHVKEGLTVRNIGWAFTTTTASNWHPLTWLSHMVDVQIFGLNPGGHHLMNALLHAINSVLLFLVLERLTGALWSSVLIAALFAIHPLHVESVAWVSELKDLLSTAFGFLMLLAYGSYAVNPRLRRYVLVAMFFVLSLLSKPMWVTGPFLLFLLDLWPLQRLKGSPLEADPVCPPVPQLPLTRLVMEKMPLFLLSAASSVITIVAQNRGGALNSLERLGLAARIENAFISYGSYLEKTFWPSALAAYYPRALAGPPPWQVVAAVLLLLAITVVALRHIRKMPWLAVGWFWFLGTLVPVIGLVQVGSQTMADRYTYLPIIGIFIAVLWSLNHFARSAARMRIPLGVAALAVVAVLSALTFQQVGYWQNQESLFRHTIAVTKDNSRAHHILSQALAVEGKIEEAVFHARESVRLDPNNPRAHKNLGYMLYQVGRVDEAIVEFQRAIALQPDYAEAHGNLAIAYGRKGWTGEAMQEMMLERKLRASQQVP